MKNLLVAQSGGPTAAINATLAGIIESAMLCQDIDQIYGAENGVVGILQNKLVCLNEKFLNSKTLRLLALTPASALGSCRKRLEDEKEIQEIIEILHAHNIGYFIYIGGNDSMDTVDKLSRYCKKHQITDITVVGAPKTIDNDLVHIDHCPGFGSAAKYIATTFSELERDCSVYQMKAVTIVEVMGRNAGWLTASSALARINGNAGPDLIYLCERPFALNRFLEDIREKQKTKDSILVAVSEGIRDEEGRYISEGMQNGAKDAFGHSYISGAARVLEDAVREQIGCKVRSIELNLMQRCSGHMVSATDIEESMNLGKKACNCAVSGHNGVMATIERISSHPYGVRYGEEEVANIANFEKKVPDEYMNEAGNDIAREMWTYLIPLIQGEENIPYQNGIPEQIHLED